MALVNISGFKNFDRIRFHAIRSISNSKSFPPSGELSCRRMNFLYRGRGGSFGQTTHIALVMRSVQSSDTNECIHSLQQEEAKSNSRNINIKRLELCINGLESGLNRQSKWFMATYFVLVLLWCRDGAASWTATGSVINFGLCNILKKVLKQERPFSHLKRSDPGMPSSHSQSIFYTSTFAIISVFQCQGLNGFTMMLCPLIFAFGSYLSWLRVSKQLHTINQVKVGAAIGTAFSILWFWWWDAFVSDAFVSNFWIRNAVILGAVGYCLGLMVSVYQNFRA